MAVSAKWYGFPDRFEWLASHGFAIEYTPNPKQFHLTQSHTARFLKNGLAVRHHGFFPGFEIGDQDEKKAELAVNLHFKALDAMTGIGEQVMTIHVGLTRNIEIDESRTQDNLERIVTYAKSRGITVCLENLKQGITSNPETVKTWANASGAMITLDVGHAVSSDWKIENRVTVPEIIDLFEDRLFEVHMYEKETNRHHAPKNMEILGPIIDRLLETDCRWWTIELEDYKEILETHRLLSDYMAKETAGVLAN